MVQKRGYLMVELVMLTALNVLFLTIFLSNYATLRREEWYAAQTINIISALVTACDQRDAQRTIDPHIQIKNGKTCAPCITGMVKPPFNVKRSFLIHLLYMRDVSLCSIEPFIKEYR